MRSISKLILALYLVTTSIGHVQASSNPSDFSVAGTISRTQSDFQVTQIASDPYFHQQWYLNTMQIPQAWDYTTGSNIIVAVIDTGIELTHPEFAGRIWTNNNEIPNNNKDDDGNGYIDDYHGYNFAEKNSDVKDYHGHGTGIASLIAANSNNGQGIAGVNQQAIIMPVKGLNNAGGGEYGDVVKSIYYAVDNGARIINMSFGAAYPDANLKDAINYAINNNVVIVAAAGNAGSDKVLYPAAYSSVISVGSLSRTLKKSYFTNYGVGLDLTAPGEEIAIADLDGGYSQGAGSSFAAAIVTGIASLAIATQPSISPTQLEAKLTTTATPLAQPVPSTDFGYGVPNALALVQLPKLSQSAVISASKNPIVADGIDESVITIKVADSSGVAQPNIPVTIRLNGEGNLINRRLVNSYGVGNTDNTGRVTFQVGSVVPGVKNLIVESSTGAFTNNPTFSLTFQQPRTTNYNMTWVKQSPYLVLAPGQTANLWVDVKNTGNVAWTSLANQTTANVKLGTDQNLDRTSIFQDSSWLGSNRVGLMSPNYVRPGEVARFEFKVKAPDVAGTFKEYFRPVSEYVSWFNDLGIYWEINVTGSGDSDFVILSPNAYGASLVSQSDDLTLSPGESKTVSVRFKNTGSASWSATGDNSNHGQVKLGTTGPNDRTSLIYNPSWESSNRVSNTFLTILPGNEFMLTFTITAPQKVGSYQESFRLVSEFVTWFGPVVTWKINVVVP